jgi:hypothetical protein
MTATVGEIKRHHGAAQPKADTPVGESSASDKIITGKPSLTRAKTYPAPPIG